MSLPSYQDSDSADRLSSIFTALWETISSKVDAYAIPAIQTRIEDWVGQDVELTELLCQYAVQYVPKMAEGDAASIIDQIVRNEILLDWESSAAAPHLSKVRGAILSQDMRDSLLITYIKVLQRGRIKVDNSPEQTALIGSGLVRSIDDDIEVANKLYAEVFDVAWVEDQIPGITKPVKIVSPSRDNSAAPSASTKLYSKLAIAACGLAVVGAAISSYIRESGGEAMATPDGLEAESALVETADSGRSSGRVSEPALASSDSISADTSKAANQSAANQSTEVGQPSIARSSGQISDRELFDRGEEHAKNSRWVLMMRDFCKIPAESVYFASAQRDLALWKGLYSEDLAIAIDIVSAEEGGKCAVDSLPSGQ